MITRSIPSLFTLGNLFLGMMAILLAIQDEPRYIDYAAILVIIGMVLDGLDGRMARMLNAASDFGKELDSLSDIVTFGVAPSVIMYLVVLHQLGPWGIAITALFPICGALRLARFSVQPGIPGFFVGLPITAAGGVLATFALYHSIFPPLFLPIGMIILSLLMVSRIKYPNFKKVGVPRAAFWITPLIIGAVALLAYRFPSEFPKIVFIPLVGYAAYGIKKSIEKSWRHKVKKKRDNHLGRR
ncbi:CDP-diacylglycerol--serine O-phosphatidyltransferase [Caldalkalibacillus uzonensis]|uniref:CDP-diacylglycerol--serine O-phosphatidyltransferase n=1 Tax=Caldalkalibacillus uzonensis TaxID=353224 RepID=A0ABU0CVN0_9BACI|nr:CDP-diacylglycerol--serine O-phosphatidyltransferase [Caldalkalibacillus uzonensis]MDQ0340158.1 CDP-diacylglycerol--serine O-phosphatidyltransferase [Caldalkalibacillus uzonensis]